MKLTMWRVVVVLNMQTKFREKYSAHFSYIVYYVLRTTTTRHMVSFIGVSFHFLANFQT